jgi:hypothetical protein
VERRKGSGLLLRCRERRVASPGCDGDERGTTPKYFAEGSTFFFFFLIELDLFGLQFQKMNLLDYILLPSSSPATTVCFFPPVSNYAYVIVHVTFKWDSNFRHRNVTKLTN